MNFLVDAQLPRRLARLLTAANHNALHTLDLPHGNATPDTDLCAICGRETRILVTKDTGFPNSFFLKGERPRLLLVSTRNIPNKELESRLRKHLLARKDPFDSFAIVELVRAGMRVQG